jgi:hypothetical protein
VNSDIKEPITLFSSQREIIYDSFKECLLPKMKVGDVMTDIPNVENTQLYSDDESSKADKLL